MQRETKIEVFQLLNSKGECGVQLVIDDKLVETWQPGEAELFACQVRACAETAIEESQVFRYCCRELEWPVSQAFGFISGLRQFRNRETGVRQPTHELMRKLHGDAFEAKQAQFMEDFMKDTPAIDPKKRN